jgi:hypothetical protein
MRLIRTFFVGAPGPRRYPRLRATSMRMQGSMKPEGKVRLRNTHMQVDQAASFGLGPSAVGSASRRRG